MRKSLLLILIVTLFALFRPPGAWAAAECNTQFTINSNECILSGEKTIMDTFPRIFDGRIYVLAKYAASALGIPPESIIWDGKEQFVTLIKPGKVVDLGVYYYWVIVNGKVEMVDHAPLIILDDQIYMSICLVAGIFGYDVEWDECSQTATIKQSTERNKSQAFSPLTYRWEYENKTFTFTINLNSKSAFENLNTPEKSLAVLHQFRRKAHPLFQVIYPQIQGDVLHWVSYAIKNYTEDESGKELISTFAMALKDLAYKNGITSNKNLAQFVVAFCQELPYQKDQPNPLSLVKIEDYPKYPVETLLDKGGDCEDKAILAAVLLKELDYDVALILYPDHLAVGIELPETEIPHSHYFPYNGKRYFYTETTSKGWPIGIMPNEVKGRAGLIFPLQEVDYGM